MDSVITSIFPCYPLLFKRNSGVAVTDQMTKDAMSAAAHIPEKRKAYKRVQEVLRHTLTNYAILPLEKLEMQNLSI